MEYKTEKLWLKFGTKLKAFILSKIHDETIADDILQEVFLKIHTKLDTVKDETKIQPWIYQITRNIIVDHYRKLKKENQISQYESKEEEEEEIPDNFMSEALQDMISMMGQLPPEYCEALCLTELEGMSQKDYAKKKGLSYPGAKSRIQRAKKLLKNMLLDCCHYHFDKYGTVIDIQPAHCCNCQTD